MISLGYCSVLEAICLLKSLTRLY